MSSHNLAPTAIAEITQEDTFNEPVVNITDVTLIIEDQKIYVCKKILAQHSSYFYDLFYGDYADENTQEYEIKDTTYDLFTMFLTMLYSGNVAINMDNFQSLAELSFRFKADHCLEKCEEFLIMQDITPGLKLRLAQGFNFKVLQTRVLESFKTLDSMISLENDVNYERFGQDTKIALIERMAKLRRGENIWLMNSGTHVKTIYGVPFKIFISRSAPPNDSMNVTVECNWQDNLNPWKCEGNISVYCEGERLKSVDHIFCNSQKILSVSRSACDIYGNISKYSVRIQAYPICTNRMHEQRLFSFEEIRPNLTDVVLLVGGKRFNVSKQVLACQSSYFETIFYSDFVEKGKIEIELKEIDATGFDIFLQQVYHSNQVITTDTIEELLKLSLMYDAKFVLKKCLDFFKNERSMNGAMQLKLAEKYNFNPLFDQVVATIKTNEDFCKVKQLEEFKELKDETIGKIARAVFKI